ncbi:uncharacterized protein LOC130785510 [Actinidia eriantha]|uniref:uncharacterized protein LOC130785510 n=1 Tax=Actinidia eriantha TaxID=165200 RepID=UPI002587EDFB|nr:uncharacterized protein LOC130785510 [Actinidia eriantha]
MAGALLVGFNAQAHWPLRIVNLKVQVGSQEMETKFVVIDICSLYNAIIGRDWIHMMKGSPLHCTRSLNLIPPEFVEEEREVLKVVGRNPKDKVVEDLIRYELNEPRSDLYFLVGLNVKEWERTELIEFLKENIEVFAWTPYEILGINPNFIRHELNIMPEARPVKQRGSRSMEEHDDTMIKEVEKLKESSAIIEVLYPSWLSNIVVVKKKNGKWHVCVDFTSLNRACLKDCFPLPKIDHLVDSTSSHTLMSFQDTFRDYHQIAMHELDREKTAFITPRGLLTLVNQDDDKIALEVRNLSGEWILAPPILGTFVCNIGDMLKTNFDAAIEPFYIYIKRAA